MVKKINPFLYTNYLSLTLAQRSLGARLTEG